MEDIFNLDSNAFVDNETKKTEIYKPKPEDGNAGVYTSLIRFIPNIRNVRNSKITKYSHWLEDVDGNGFYVDCPTSINEKCPICERFFQLRNSDSAIKQEQSKNFKRQTSFFHLIQIVEDKHRPELNGKLMVFKFGWKINEKYKELLEPDFGEPVVPADLFNGKNFILKLRKVGGYNNYDSCKFEDSVSAITINEKTMTTSKGDKEKIKEYLETAPILEDFEYKPWTAEDKVKIDAVLKGKSINGGKSAPSVSIDDTGTDTGSTDLDDSGDDSEDTDDIAGAMQGDDLETSEPDLDDEDNDWLKNL